MREEVGESVFITAAGPFARAVEHSESLAIGPPVTREAADRGPSPEERMSCAK
jgi:hypothetical protein